jgi:uncharacterized protein YbbK (DUF523 family)
MERLLISACLVGQKVRYNATDAKSAWTQTGLLERWQAEGRLVAFCPELAGGFPVPRPAAEIAGGTGAEVLTGQAQVIEQNGNTVSEFFILGAHKALQEAQRLGIRAAILKEGSPSCGVHVLYQGDFSGQMKAGRGVTTELFEQNGIRVFNEQEAELAAAFLIDLEKQT